MTGHRFIGWALLGTGLLGVLPLVGVQGGPQQGNAIVHIVLVSSLFRDVPSPMIEMAKQPFYNLMKAQTGLTGELVLGGDALHVGQQLEKKNLQLAVFHGVEFAWAQERYPNLRPLVIAINRHRNVYAQVMVRNDTTFTQFADLKDKKVSLPRGSREHCHLFLQKLCKQAGSTPATFFAQTVAHANPEDALDDVLRGKVQAAIVDSVALECYAQVKSGCRARLKVLKQSELFPAVVIAYRQGSLDASTIEVFRKGMLSANKSASGRDLLAMWKLTGFEAIPNDFQQTLDNIRQAYPLAQAAPAKEP